MTEQELEVKLNVRNLEAVEQRLIAAGGILVHPRVLEMNCRFDTQDESLAKQGKVLRLRKDSETVMTFKGPCQEGQEVSIRQEIEFTVSNYITALHFLQALGYRIDVFYEKYRTTYEIEDTEVVLDEMPFGKFIEIEGPNPDTIHMIANKLGLNWDVRIINSYLGLFRIVKERRGFNFQDLTFENFKTIEIKPEDLGVKPAD